MSETQTYRVETIYDVTDRASKSLGEIEKSAARAAQSTHSLKQMIMGLGAAHLGRMALGAVKSQLLDYNSSLEQSKTVIAGMLTLYTGASMERTWERASVSVERFQQMAAKSSLTTKELVETAQGLTRPLIQVGVKMGDIEKITFGVANAAKAFGMNGSVVAMDIEQALRGGVTEKDRFIKSMLAQKGIELSADQFNKKGQGDRIDILKRALTSPAISAMAEKQSQTMSGVLSTLEDNIQIALGRVGLPLFKAITSEVKGWNTWIEKNSGRIEEIGKSVGSAMMSAFRTIKDIASAVFPILKELMGVVVSAMQFAAEHKDVLIGLVKGLMVYKIGSTIGRAGMGAMGDVGGLFGGIGGGFGQLKDTFGKIKSSSDPLASAFGNLSSILMGAGGVIGGLGKLALAAYTLGGFIFGKTEKEKQQEALGKAQILAAGEFQKARKESKDIESYMSKFGADARIAAGEKLVNPDLLRKQQRYQELQANIGATQAKLIEEGIKGGMVSETFENGRRKLSLTASGTSDTTIAGHGAMMSQLTEVFKEQALRAARSGAGASRGEIDNTLGQFYGLGQGLVGFYTEEIAKRAETADEFDKSVQASAPKQTVNITIQQVTAKDPNRWLAEMDDMVARRTRSNTRAKRALKASPH